VRARTGRNRPSPSAHVMAIALVAVTLVAALVRPAQQRGWLGVTLGDHRTAGSASARIDTVLRESPAAAAGLTPGDLVHGAGARTIHTARELTDTVRRTPPGTTLVLRIEHAGSPADVPVVISVRPPDLYRLLEADRDGWQDPARVLELLAADPGDVIADVGAGGGYFTARLATAVGPSGLVIAIDIDNDALEQLTTRFAHAENVEVRRGLATDPRLEPNSVDRVLMVDTFHELQAPNTTLAAVRRALRAGGRLVIVDRPAAEYVAGAHAVPEARVLAEAEATGLHLHERADLARQFAVVLTP
jgi:precorrin-6B methylase 2